MKGLKDKILSETSEANIFLHYMRLMGYENYKFRQNVRSPFRKETNPSFGIYQGSDSHYYFKDFAGDNGDCWKFASTYYEIYCGKQLAFYELLVNVATEMKINTAMRGKTLLKRTSIVVLPEIRKIFENMREISMHLEPVFATDSYPTPAQKEYLSMYGITDFDSPNINYLDSKVTVKDDIDKTVKTEWFSNGIHNPVFTFEAESFFDGSKAFRIYQPKVNKNSDQYKHYGNVKSHHIYNPEKYPALIESQKTDYDISRILVLLGGYKDAFLFNELTPFNCCSTGGESWGLHPSFIDWIRKCGFLPVVFYDADSVGLQAAAKLSMQYGIPSVRTDDFGTAMMHCKDFSDMAQEIKLQENAARKTDPECRLVFYQESLIPTIYQITCNHNWTKWNLG